MFVCKKKRMGNLFKSVPDENLFFQRKAHKKKINAHCVVTIFLTTSWNEIRLIKVLIFRLSNCKTQAETTSRWDFSLFFFWPWKCFALSEIVSAVGSIRKGIYFERRGKKRQTKTLNTIHEKLILTQDSGSDLVLQRFLLYFRKNVSVSQFHLFSCMPPYNRALVSFIRRLNCSWYSY